MLTLGPLAFLSPWILAAALLLPVIWWLLRITPPAPDHVFFPATRLLADINRDEEDRAHSPWWLTLLRLVAAAAVILAIARPVLDPRETRSDKADLLIAVIDNGWASAGNWGQHFETMLQLLEQAEQNDQPVLLLPTANTDERRAVNPVSAFRGREQFTTIVPHPFAPDRMKTLRILKKARLSHKNINLVWLSDGLDYGHAEQFAKELAKLAGGPAHLAVIRNPSDSPTPLAVHAGIGKKGHLQATVTTPGKIDYKGHLRALDNKGRPVLEKPFTLVSGKHKTSVTFDLPLELRNQITRVEIKNMRSAATTFLVDGRANWQRIGLIGGETVEEAQPLLSPLYYIRKALKPWGEITLADNRNTAKATKALLARDVSVLVLAGIGRLEESTTKRLKDWLERGGIVVRFAGPRLEQGGDDLLPVPLRRGGRALGGALSWSKPQKLAEFEQNSPFYGLPVPKDVSVKRQVLADPSQLADHGLVWARLADGTPLVTARKTGRGLLVLFHVTANSDWSDLPHSVLFVKMLRRITELSTGIASKGDKDSIAVQKAGQKRLAEPKKQTGSRKHNDIPALPPLRLLDGFGELTEPDVDAEPMKIAAFGHAAPDRHHPPGLYGTIGHIRALNIGTKNMKLHPLPAFAPAVRIDTYKNAATTPLAPWLLALALVLFLIDGLVVIMMRGRLAPGQAGAVVAKSASLALILAGGLLLLLSLSGLTPVVAAPARQIERHDSDAFQMKMSLETRLAFVRTGHPDIDRISFLGLRALTRTIARRTALEPAEPVGVNIRTDELAFFPLLYWPVPLNPQHLDSATLARINAYMKQGGMILFDTRDQISNFLPSSGSNGRTPLARLLARMDIPPLEPVPHDHVLTRSFYLLDSFPGRYAGGTMWVEATDKRSTGGSSSTARSSDGVSSILVTSNNLAAAWATDDSGRTLFAVTPDGERQREMAYRTGINIVMYALPVHYNADQVHLPALMRRLGQ